MQTDAFHLPSGPNRLPAAYLWLTATVFFTLPFVYAGTIPLGFPLKLYELILVFLVLMAGLQVMAVRQRGWSVTSQEKRVLLLGVLFVMACAVSSVYGFFFSVGGGADVWIRSWRENPGLASFLKWGYVFLDLFFLAYILAVKGLPLRFLLICWLLGAVVAALYGWYLFVVSYRGGAPFLLPGLEEVQTAGALFPGAIRGGTFREGNHVGLFYILSGAVGIYLLQTGFRWWILGAVLFVFSGVIHSQSTVNILGCLVFGTSWIFCLLLVRGRHLMCLVSLAAVVGAVSLLSQTEWFDTIVTSRLKEEDPNNLSGSLSQRKDLLDASWQMFGSSPVLGVGLSNFGYLYPSYTSYVSTEIGFDPAEKKNVANNVYAEILAETGLMGLALFSLFLWTIGRCLLSALRHRGICALAAGCCAMLFVWLAYPTFSILFEWAFLALCVRCSVAALQAESRRRKQPLPPADPPSSNF